MTWIEIVVLALIQGVTEFLPVSSSAHLILPSELLGWQDQGLAFDVAVHVGTLLAVMSYYRKRIYGMVHDNVVWLAAGRKRGEALSAQAKLMWLIGIGTLPAGIIGFLANDWIEANLRSMMVIALATLVFGLLLGLADWRAKMDKPAGSTRIRDIIVIGFAQALALIPGTSRSGITITAALFLGFKRDEAANISFLLSIPLILAAGGLKALELLQADTAVEWVAIGAGALIAFVFAYLAIALFLKLLDRVGMLPFVVYRIVLAAVLFAVVLL